MKRRPNGHGSVYFDNALNRYVARITLGNRRKKSLYGPPGDKSPRAKMSVEERMKPLLGLRSSGTNDLTAAIRAYISSDHLSPTTTAVYKTAAKHIIGDPKTNRLAHPIARKELLMIEPSDIRAFYLTLDTGSAMKQKIHVLLHRVFEEAMRSEVVPRNPVSIVLKPKGKRPEVAIWTPTEVERFLKAARSHRLYALFLLSLTSTMGPAELFGLRRDDVRLDEGYLVVQRNLVNVNGKTTEKSTKTKKRQRRIELPRVTISALRERMAIALAEGHAGSRYLFTSAEGGPIQINNFRKRVWVPLMEAAKVPRITLYGMRHTANALMGHLGVPIAVASARLGHASPKMTLDVYGHLYEGVGQGAASKLDAFFEKIKA